MGFACPRLYAIPLLQRFILYLFPTSRPGVVDIEIIQKFCNILPDIPNSKLTEGRRLFQIPDSLRKRGIAVVYRWQSGWTGRCPQCRGLVADTTMARTLPNATSPSPCTEPIPAPEIGEKIHSSIKESPFAAIRSHGIYGEQTVSHEHPRFKEGFLPPMVSEFGSWFSSRYVLIVVVLSV